jgi:hypothetical protein
MLSSQGAPDQIPNVHLVVTIGVSQTAWSLCRLCSLPTSINLPVRSSQHYNYIEASLWRSVLNGNANTAYENGNLVRGLSLCVNCALSPATRDAVARF